MLSVDHRGLLQAALASRLHVGPGERHVLGLAVDPHSDPAGSWRRGQRDGGPEPPVEVGGRGEARDPDLGAGGATRGALTEHVPGQLVADDP